MFGNFFLILFAPFCTTHDIICGRSSICLFPSPFHPLPSPTVCQTVLPLSHLTDFANKLRVIYAPITSAFKYWARKSNLPKLMSVEVLGKPSHHCTQLLKMLSQQKYWEAELHGQRIHVTANKGFLRFLLLLPPHSWQLIPSPLNICWFLVFLQSDCWRTWVISEDKIN